MTGVTRTETPSGTWNFRDLGGTTTEHGRSVRHGLLYRSATLSELDPPGVAALTDLGITDVFDLRGRREVGADGADRVPDAVTVHAAAFNPEEDETPAHEAAPDAGQDAGRDAGLEPRPDSAQDRTPAGYMRRYMASLPSSAPAQRSMRALLEAAAGPSTGAVLVHCAAGKDRTGWAVATLLRAIGVGRDAVVDDYLLSNAGIGQLRTYIRRRYEDAVNLPDSALGVDASYLEAGWDAVDARFGSFDGYLAAIGADDALLARLRDRLLE